MTKLAVIFLCACVFAPAAPAQTAESIGLGKNTTLQIELKKSVDANKVKPGDEVTATLTQDVLEAGRVVLPRGAKVTGHVSEAQAHTKEHPESKLGLVFDKVVGKGGAELACTCIVAAVAAPIAQPLSANKNDDVGVPQTMGSKGNLGGGTLGGIAAPKRDPDRRTGKPDSATPGIDDGNSSNTNGPGPQGALSGGSKGVFGIEGVSLYSSEAG
ncbi:MAG TPA: hypothetical protein VFL42_10275, partial [Terriglobales bacterium]|nr:hypothetical protein [Terriglobales bacterium]